MGIVTARIDADAATIGLTVAAAVSTRIANATAADPAGAGVSASPTVFWIG